MNLEKITPTTKVRKDGISYVVLEYYRNVCTLIAEKAMMNPSENPRLWETSVEDLNEEIEKGTVTLQSI